MVRDATDKVENIVNITVGKPNFSCDPLRAILVFENKGHRDVYLEVFTTEERKQPEGSAPAGT